MSQRQQPAGGAAAALTGALASLKLTELRRLLTRVGALSSGKKELLVTRLQRELSRTTLHFGERRSARVLSIDMGIKNLAFCVCDIETSRRRAGRGSVRSAAIEQSSSLVSNIHVNAWRRISLLSPSLFLPGSTKIKATKDGDSSEADTEADDFYQPAKLSRIAYALAKNVLLPYHPDVILIERQRFRSGGSSEIQEWTVRVNMLESMLWAVLRTLQGEAMVNAKTAEAWSVSPQRVGLFWLHGDDGEAVKPPSNKATASESRTRPRVQKQDKIDIVKRWMGCKALAGSSEHAAQPAPSFTLGEEAEDAAAIFREGRKKRTYSKKNPVTKQTVVDDDKAWGKLDDLADALLQAAAWVRWEENRREIAGLMIGMDEEESKAQALQPIPTVVPSMPVVPKP